MSFIEKIKIFNKNSNENNKANKIVDKLPENKQVTFDILEYLGNTSTKLIEDKDIKNNYYVFLNDTIYLNTINKNKYFRICVIAHECIHSIQSKILQKINFISSNLEILLFSILVFMYILNLKLFIIALIYTLVVILNILVRFMLEIDAVKRSTIISDKYLNNKLSIEEKNYIVEIYKFQIKLLFPIFLINLFVFKILRIMLIYFIYYIF